VSKPAGALINKRVCIIGLGLMGGSLARALHAHCQSLTGVDTDPAVVEFALDHGLVEKASTIPERVVPDADVVILACPVLKIIDWIHRLPEFIQYPCVVLDMGSTKAQIISAMDEMPENFQAIGGHPICGKETLSIENSEPGLFSGAPFVLVRSQQTTQNAESLAAEMVSLIGGRAVWMTAAEHDRALAATSHLPFLVASALAMGMRGDDLHAAGPGLRSTTRLAGTPVSMMLDVLLTNRSNILAEMQQFRKNFAAFESALDVGDDVSLGKLLEYANNNHASLVS